MNNEDTISRAAAIEALAFGTDGDYDTLHVYEVKDRIAALPSVPPQEAHGRWIAPTELDGHWVAECSWCHKIRALDDFCSACGAKMDGGEDDAAD